MNGNDPLPPFLNLLEPPAYAELFRRIPPIGFRTGRTRCGTPLFRTSFDLLTTLEPDALTRWRGMPLFRFWSRLLRFQTCFAGTTITEYAPLPQGVPACDLLDQLLAETTENESLTIFKDLPDASPLLPEADNALAEELAREAAGRGFLTVQGQALAYLPIDFPSADVWLGRLSGARRKDLRRKMKKRDQLEVDEIPLGDAFFFQPGIVDEFYALYTEVFEQSLIHFDLLSRDFFAALLQSRYIEGVVLRYRLREADGGTTVGYNLCLIHNGRLIDKYIGLRYPRARELNLYFISWMCNLEYAVRRNLAVYVAGWTDPEVKAALGASFTFTRHLVRVRNPLLRRVLVPLRHCFESDGQALEKLKRGRA